MIKKQRVSPYRYAFPVCALTQHPTPALRMTLSINVNSNPGAAQAHWWLPHDHEQWLRTEHVAGKMRCYGSLGLVTTGQPVCSSRGQSRLCRWTSDQTRHPLYSPCSSPGSCTTDTPGKGCSPRNCLLCNGRRGGQQLRHLGTGRSCRKWRACELSPQAPPAWVQARG